ncbi:hypothetical protein GLAREA_04072 [Glarea lozoyensis ATCC 20868]|uniref:Uncharacterized protein n=1 Tax=Glarea lozoyensis (strain ATCC 20868 / MF5171) TaxID=1116229 RepID=S3CZR7_GLAL2|nr:uncharacterized protein GLAREA_04072 [Glarea lozoyensis ATCC 20868]EPE31105.1 hypothetical protein GLAREA_04072 [Glarea lozoyensis ATCC 20868]
MSQQSGQQRSSHGRSGGSRRDGGQSSSNSQGGEGGQGGYPASGSSNQQHEQIFTYQTARLPGQPVHDISSLPQGLHTTDAGAITYLNATSDPVALQAYRQQASNPPPPNPNYLTPSQYPYSGSSQGANPLPSSSSGGFGMSAGQASSSQQPLNSAIAPSVKDGEPFDMSLLPVTADGDGFICFGCPLEEKCGKKRHFTYTEIAMVKHLREKHGIEQKRVSEPFECPLSSCDFMCWSQHGLSVHTQSSKHILSTDSIKKSRR